MTATRTIGEIEVTALSDGPFPASLDALLDVDRGEAERLTGLAPGAPLILAVNAYLVRLGAKWALIDTGCGTTMGPDLGQVPNNLRVLGVPRRRSSMCS